MTPENPHPLWLNSSNLSRLRRRVRENGVVGQFYQHALDVYAQIRESNLPSDHPGMPRKVVEKETFRVYEKLEVAAFLAVVDENKEAAELASSLMVDALHWDTLSDLGRSDQAIHLAQVYSWCFPFWSEEMRTRTEDFLLALAKRLQPGASDCQGNPDNPFNNWYGVTQGGAGLAALAILHRRPEAALILDRCRERVTSYLANYGEEGISYEGIGYGCYALHGWGPLVLALRECGQDVTTWAPGLARATRFIAALCVARQSPSEIIDDDSERPAGSRLTWNDDGTGLPAGRHLGLLYALGQPEWQPTIEAYWATCRQPGELPIGNRGSGFSWLAIYWPESLGDQAPDRAALPPALFDKRLGWTVFRNRYQDAEDCVLGVYAKAYHPGGHSHEDVGSWRLYGLDGGWSQGGGQNKTAPVYQSTILKNGFQTPSEGGKGVTEGRVSYHRADPDGSGVVNVRMGKVYRSLVVDRNFAIDFSGRGGVPTVLGIFDDLWDREVVDWSWTLCFENDLEYQPWPEENGFILRQPRNGATAAFRMITPAGIDFKLVEGEPTQRTFSGGFTKHYYGSRYIEAKVRADKAAFFTVVTLQKGEIPPLTVTGEGEDARVRLGDLDIYRQKGKWYHGPVRIEPTGPAVQ